MAPPGKSDIKVTASDALEFEPVAHELPKRRWGLRMFVVLVLAAGGAAGWHYYGERLQQLWGGAESGIPLIKAATTPVKLRPENPGGLEVPDRDKLVYDRLQGNAEGRGPERLLPPPEQPLPRPAPATATPAPQPPAAGKPATAEPPPSPPIKPVAKVPTEKDVAAAERPAPPPPPPAPPTASKSSPGLTMSRRPAQTETPKAEAPKPAPAKAEPEKPNVPESPASPKEAVTAATTPASSPPAAPAAAPAPVPSGRAYVVQLAAARSQEGAEIEWEKLRSKNQDLLGNLRLIVTKADLGQARGVFYRLRAGPIADEAAARELCSQLTKRQVGCLVIKPGQ
ncbi:MAG: SPOR domain-containing protein [Rhodospirillales bacterium]|nr:SPOR domain-containing protein [Rhodospirillales bacterium]MBI3113027.1 SPOR domain-containing protein [Rhodospirillales bacterium]